MLQTIAAGKFKAKCLHLMDEVQQQHKSIIITKHGKPIARLVPFEENHDQRVKNLFGYMQTETTILGDIIAPIDEIWEADQNGE